METSAKNIHQDMINRCRQNDGKAQFEVYKLYYKQMYNTSYRILNNAAQAEDIMQESFLDAFKKIKDYTGKGNFGGWLRRIVVNNSIDALNKRKDTISLDENLTEAIADQSDSSDEIEYQVEEIKKAMLLLPEEYRVIISLLLFEGYDHNEISQILKIKYNASRTRYSRARKKLLKILSEKRSIKMFNPN